MKTRTTRLLAVTGLAVLSLGALTGCTALRDAVYQEASHEFATAADVVQQWDKTAPWLPSDATEIATRETTDGDVASLIARSGAELDPALCAQTDRRSAPTFPLEGAPDVFALDTVWACGAWAVVATDNGWFGWTPSNPGEQDASPAS
jgi:hypothetical protein